MARTTTTAEPAVRAFATHGGPTPEQLQRDGSPWISSPSSSTPTSVWPAISSGS